MGIKAIDYENLSEGDLITWYGMHVLRWEDEIRPYGIEPSIAFVQDNTQDELIAELLAACQLALTELDRIGSDIGFEPDRYQERINALDALSRAVRKAE